MNDFKKIRVCLVNAPVLGVLEPWYDTPDFVRTGLAYLAGYLRQFEGFEISIIDAKFEQLSFEEAIARIVSHSPDVIGFTAFTNEIKPAAYLAAKIKRLIPDTLTVIGGVHVTAIPEKTMEEFPFFDIGVIGEGELTFYELCQQVRIGEMNLSNVDGLILREKNQLVKTKVRNRIVDQDSIPTPAWDLLPRADTYYIQSERGCPLACIFCMNPNGKVARKRSVDNVITEMNLIIDTYHPKRITFGDELFTIDMDRAKELLDAMIKYNIGMRVKWDVQTHVQYLDQDLFAKFKLANVDRVEIGIETGDDEALRKMGKGITMQKISNAVELGQKNGVNIGTFFLFGQPDETIHTLNKTIDLAVKINPTLPMFGIMTPYPGTKVAKLAAEGKGGYKLLTTNWDEYNKQLGGAMEFANLTRKQIEWMQAKAYLKVYLFNLRFKDLFFFILEYYRAGITLLKKMISGQNSLNQYFTKKPTDYDLVLNTRESSHSDFLLDSYDSWNEYQTQSATMVKKQNLVKA